MSLRARLIQALIPLLISGCLHYEEEITLKEDGSGTVLFHYWLSERCYEPLKDYPMLPFTEERARERMESEHVKLGEFIPSQIGEDMHFTASFSFDDVRRLGQTGLFEAEPITLKKDPQGFWVFERTIQGSRDGMLKDMPDDKSLKDFWGTYEMKFVVHFPGLVMEANTKQIKKDTATWTIPLSALSGGKRKMRATYRIGKPRKREAQGLKTAWDEKGDWLNTVRHGNCRGA